MVWRGQDGGAVAVAAWTLGLLTVPFKADAACRHHSPRQRHRATNSAAYDAALRQRGSLTVWFTDAAIAAWRAEPRTTRGGQLDQAGPLASTTADGAYDQDGVQSEVAGRSPDAAVIVPPRSNAVPSDTAGTAPPQRDRHLRAIFEHGRRRWQKTSGHHWRARVEAAVSRSRRVIGGGLRSRTNRRRGTEIALAVGVLNRMLELGRPEYIRTA